MRMEIKTTSISLRPLNVSFKRYNKSFKRHLCCFHSNFLVLISFLVNILERKDDKSFKRHICRFNFFFIFLSGLLILIFILSRHNMSFEGYNESFKGDICCFVFHSHYFSFSFDKYQKRNGPPGVPYFTLNKYVCL